jgi:membrane fusion protein, multidrug efflux system
MITQVDMLVERPMEEPIITMPKRPLKERLRWPLMVALPLMLAVVGAGEYVAEEPFVSTDDAFVRMAKESINARVSGQVVDIAVRDNQRVSKGQLLFRIDPEPYQIAIDQAEADLGTARLQIEALKTKFHEQLAELQSAKDTVIFDEHEYDRNKVLVADDFASRENLERTETKLQVSQQAVASIMQQIASTVVALNGDPNIAIERHPVVRAAQARLDREKLALSYAEVLAPDDGIVTKVEDLQVGDYVNPGAAVFSMLSSRRIWIEANFRETDLTHMRPGQPATIDVDAYPGQILKAHVVSFSPGTGSDFAVLPPENATGNWVKVIQRLPVRLELDDLDADPPLFSGISVTARVDTGYRFLPWHPIHVAAATEPDR